MTMIFINFLSLLLFLILLGSSMMSIFFFCSGLTLFMEFNLTWLLQSCDLVFLLLLDWMSLSFLSTVSLISLVVFIYSKSYMSSDKLINSFITLVFLFVVSMFLMVLSPNVFSVLLGWDGLGLVSYGLVIYYQNWKSGSAGMITLLSNRLGDLALLLCICWMLCFGSLSLYDMQYVAHSDGLVITPFFLLLLAAMTKSAQIPFSAWLPAAMAAPTPVSSLVHSSTLVTAGVYLLIRFNFSLNLNYYLMIISLLTMFMSGAGAMFEMDLKKVIALSTLSQLGVMMFVISVGSTELAFFHLLSHALFKSLLFLCAGFYIHSNSNWQDSRLFSNSYYLYPVFSFFFSVASLSLCGFPFLSGFYSKDLILELFFYGFNYYFIFLFLCTATVLTLLYSLRLIYMSSLMNSMKLSFMGLEDWVMIKPMMALFGMSVAGGSILSWMFFPSYFIILPVYMKLFILSLLVFSFLVMTFYKNIKMNLIPLTYFASMWNLPLLSSLYPQIWLSASLKSVKIFDQGWLEALGGQGLHTMLSNRSLVSDYYSMINLKSILFISFLMTVVAMIMMMF